LVTSNAWYLVEFVNLCVTMCCKGSVGHIKT